MTNQEKMFRHIRRSLWHQTNPSFRATHLKNDDAIMSVAYGLYTVEVYLLYCTDDIITSAKDAALPKFSMKEVYYVKIIVTTFVYVHKSVAIYVVGRT